MLSFIFKQVYETLTIIMLILVFFKMDNKLIFNSTLCLLVAYIPLGRYFMFMKHTEEVKALISAYPIIDAIDYFLPFLVVIMTFIVLAKYKKHPSSIFKTKE